MMINYETFKKSFPDFDAMYYTYATHPDYPNIEAWISGKGVTGEMHVAKNIIKSFGWNLAALDGSYVFHVASGKIVAKLVAQHGFIQIRKLEGRENQRCAEKLMRGLYLLSDHDGSVLSMRRALNKSMLYLAEVRIHTD